MASKLRTKKQRKVMQTKCRRICQRDAKAKRGARYKGCLRGCRQLFGWGTQWGRIKKSA